MTYKEQLKKINEYTYELPKTGDMNVPGLIFASKVLMEKIEDDAIKQVANVACLPGIYKYSLAMPDLHTGYGFGIGGVAALDYENGGISPGGIGYDINCGVRLLRTNLKKDEIYPKIKPLLESLFKHTPAGLGSSNIRVSKEQINDILEKGAKWAVDNGYGNKEDLEFCEENGGMKDADASAVSEKAKDRGFKQVATLGSGNHFLEVQYVDEIFDEKTAKAFGIEKGQVMLMIHCLPKDTRILTEYGYTLKINELEKNWNIPNVKCMNFEKHNLEDTKIIKFFRLKPHSRMFKIITKSGKELKATGDHPVLTPNGLKFMKEILKGERVAVLPFEGVEYKKPENKIIVTEDDIRKIGGSEKTIKNLKKKNLLPLNLTSEYLPILTKLLGFLTGDGWLGKNRERWTMKFIGALEDLEKIKKDISRLGYTATGPYKCFSKSEITYHNGQKKIINGLSYQIVITSLALPMLFYALGAPFGNKSKVKFNVPSWIFKAPLWTKRLYLAGFFGAELNKPSNPKNEEYRFRNPLLSINKLEKLKSNGHAFLKEISKLLKDFGIKTIKILELGGVITKSGDKTTKLRLKISSKKENLIRLWSKIGYEYCQKRTMLSSHTLQYLNFEQQDIKKEAFLANKLVPKLSITSHKFRTHSEVVPFPTFVSSFKLNPPSPIMWDVIEQKEEIENFDDYVFDFTVNHKDHNFVADGFVTGNCGSRGLGHQVCSDYLRGMEHTFPDIVAKLPDRELIYAPAQHPLAKKYFSAMAAAANFAWCNRHVIGHQSRIAFSEIFPNARLETVYDVAHNICKIEEHYIDGKKTKVYMHRKGATRAFGPGNPEIPRAYRKVGQPIILPGSMGTSSFILVGTEKAEEISFASTAHGAGREMSRHEALRRYTGEGIKKDLESKKIFIKSASWDGIAEEAPGAYKDIDEVVEVSHQAGIGNKVARLRPIGVIKG